MTGRAGPLLNIFMTRCFPVEFLLLGHAESDGTDRRPLRGFTPFRRRYGLPALGRVVSEDLLPYFLEEGRELTERASKALFDLERGVETPPKRSRERCAQSTRSRALRDFSTWPNSARCCTPPRARLSARE